MTGLKTKPTNKGVDQFLKKVENPTKREDSFKILELMKEVTKEEPVMWGDSIVGFGNPHRKKEEKCPSCNSDIIRFEISGRHGFFCPSCQVES